MIPADRLKSRPVSRDRRVPTPAPAGADKAPLPFPLLPVYALWVLMTWEVDQFLSGMIGGPFYRAPLLLVPVLVIMLLARGSRKAVYWPLIVFVMLHFAAALFAENIGLARDAFKYMVYVLVLFASSVSALDAPAKIVVLLKLYLVHFVWFGIQGLPTGRVMWHPLLGNEDSYGPLMVIGLAFSYFFAMATPLPRWRWVARFAFALCLLGVVVSFARGAALAAGAVLLYILLRSPRRVGTVIGLLVIALLLVPVAGLFVPLDEYIAEVRSSAEGDDGRIAVWTLAWNVFLQSPLWGVGALNFGVVASQITDPDPTRAKGADPVQLWNAWVHNAPMQILAEEGLIGILVCVLMLAGFFRRTARLRTPEASTRWAAQGGGALDARIIALALDGAMVGWLACSIFYNQIYLHWFWSLLIFAHVMAEVVGRDPDAAGGTPAPARAHR
jgi:O-antigen ligase